MTKGEVLALWRDQPEAAEWDHLGDRVTACAERPGLYAIHSCDVLLALLDVSQPKPRVIEMFDPPTQELVSTAEWHELS